MKDIEYQFIDGQANLSPHLKAAYIKRQYHEEKKLSYHQARFPGGRVVWGIFKNKHYDEEVEGVRKGDEKMLKYYKHEFIVPKYNIHKNGRKIGVALARNIQDDNNKPFLFIPDTRKLYKRKHGYFGIGRNYYIFNVDNDYLMPDEAILLRFTA